MKAVVLGRARDLGSLTVEDVPVPPCGPGEVLVKIRAASINAADYRSIQMGLVPKRRIFGADVAGIVEAVGAGVTEFRRGDEVAGDLAEFGFGGFAEFVAADARAFVPKPAGLSFVEAAAIPLAAQTAAEALRSFGDDLSGRDVLVWGASGGVGSYAVQLAKVAGARVTAVCGPTNVPLVADLGPDTVYDYTQPERPPVAGADLIVVVQGNRSLGFYRRYLKTPGRCVVVGGSLGQIFGAMATAPFLSLGRQKFGVLSFRADRDRLAPLLELAAQRKIRPVVEAVVDLAEIPQMLRYASGGHAHGKLVMKNPEENPHA